ncbi:hypothetical protein OA84_00965 [Kaistella solincola]|uniref:Uncharacterized protein n=1 Tax=Kaistella solincola TaxID=510955 RepID=A0ABR4ZT95_9FLAO|nr:hypothetical protein [Kaistella solincola]KIA84155.1 hypothetical protein OA84_00965 [Kaistella solincola]
MKANLFYLVFAFCFFQNCNDVETQSETPQIEQQSSNNVGSDYDSAEPMNNSSGRENEISLGLLNIDKKPFRATLNIGVEDFMYLSNLNITEAENFLESKNWFFLSKKVNVLTDTGTDFIAKAVEDINEGTVIKYRNGSEDSDCIFHFKSSGDTKLSIETTNHHNYTMFINELNELGFTSVGDGDNFLPYSNRLYVGDLLQLDINARRYKKNSFKIDVITEISSPILELKKSSNSGDGYDYIYNENVKVYSYYIRKVVD